MLKTWRQDRKASGRRTCGHVPNRRARSTLQGLPLGSEILVTLGFGSSVHFVTVSGGANFTNHQCINRRTRPNHQ